MSVLYVGNEKWIAVGKDTNGTIAISENNGLNWNILDPVTSNSFTLSGSGIAQDDCGKLVAVGQSDLKTIIYSEDGGNTWLESESGQFTFIGFNVEYANGIWVAVGANDSIDPNAHTIKYSFNGKNWYNTGCNEFTEKNDSDFSGGVAVAYGCGNWVTVGLNDPKDSKTIKYVEPIEEPVNYGGSAFYNYTVTRGNKISNTRNVDYTSSFKSASLNGKSCLGVISSKKQKKLTSCSTNSKKNCRECCEITKPSPKKSFNLSISRNTNLNFLASRKIF